MTPESNRTNAVRLASRTRDLDDTPDRGRTEVSIVVPPSVIEAVRSALLAGETHYTSRPGVPALRALAAEALARLGGPRYDPEVAVVITAGERESLFVTLLGLQAGPGEVFVAGPTAHKYDSLFGLMSLAPVAVDHAAFPAEPPKLLYRERDVAPVMHSAILHVGETAAVVDVLNTKDSIGAKPFRQLPPIALDRTVVVGGFDALPGIGAFGAGFVAASAAVMRKIKTWKQAFSICTSAPSQRAALVLLDEWWKEAQ